MWRTQTLPQGAAECSLLNLPPSYRKKNSALRSITANSPNFKLWARKNFLIDTIYKRGQFSYCHNKFGKALPFSCMTPSEKQQEHSLAADTKQKLLLSLHPRGSDKKGHLGHNVPLKKVYLLKYSGCDWVVCAYLVSFWSFVQKYLSGSHT